MHVGLFFQIYDQSKVSPSPTPLPLNIAIDY